MKISIWEKKKLDTLMFVQFNSLYKSSSWYLIVEALKSEILFTIGWIVITD